MDRTISASVGRNGWNKPDDVRTVQELLNGVDTSSGGPDPPLDVDGKCGRLTKRAIETFQLHNFGWSGTDGRVDPDHATLAMLNIYNKVKQPVPTGPPPAPPRPQPEPLSVDFRLWLRFPGRFFDTPTKAEQFVFTMIDVTNSRSRNYLFEMSTHGAIASPPLEGSGGHMAKLTPRKPTTVSGFVGPAVYTTRLRRQNGGQVVPTSQLALFPGVWKVGDGTSGVSLDFDAHLERPLPGTADTSHSLPGRFRLL